MDKINELIEKEFNRQNNGIELIASENYPSKAVRDVMSSILTAKYAEGYPGKRYYGGCEFIDQIENIAIDRAKELFGSKFANVQPHSGSQANAAAYRALEKQLIKDGKLKDRKMKVLSVQLNDGGHLTHGSSVSFSSNLYDFSFYNLDETGHIDFDLVEESVKENKPDVILTGYSAYPYQVDFSGFKKLADKYDCKLIVDMAHIAGLVAAGLHQNPCEYADVVTTTTHKTLRGPRGGLILTNDEELYKLINSAVFPYYQGGPLEHVIASKAICFEEALQPEFKTYMEQVLTNTKMFAKRMVERGATCTQTENHLMLLNVKETFGMTGLEAQNKLEEIGITTNKNMISNDTETPAKTSGLRIGFAALTTRNCNELLAMGIADLIYDYLSNKIKKDEAISKVSNIITQLKDLETV